MTHTRVEYGFAYVYFDGSDRPTQYRDGKRILAERAIKMGID